MIFPFSSKLPDVGTTIFSVMSALAAQHQAINLSQGFPDFDTSEELKDLVNVAMQKGFNQYAPMPGLAALRETIAAKVQSLYGTTVDADTEITITPGGTYAIFTAIATCIGMGDEVIIFEPAYDSYIPNVLVNGGVPVLIPLAYPDYHIDWALVKSKITTRTKMIIINSPHNPTGTILKVRDLQQLEHIAELHNLLVLSDEVYEHLVFDGVRHESVLRYPNLLKRSFVVFSFGKVFHITGWKMGYCIAPAHLMAEYRKVHQYLCFSVNTPMQHGLAAFLQNPAHYEALGRFFQQKRDLFLSLMQDARFTPLPSQGSYFQLMKYDQISDEGDKDFAVRVTQEIGVATIPVSAFYQDGKDDHVIRFCFAKKDNTLERAAERLRKL
ncbi:2-keto-4-methylthiobutyrate aminotransferase apoenzyme [Chitinophaga costaii]|uniref:2-keto-4-methylthiobutyrate aminotransferase apoenzyme n=1 Tax=Chitinophaga costaii TaxID=1335309 RepID=A0A1C4AGC7_9BACT|nr:methionine aminotransferase [Chitinophaga costaii]PUZ26591.1 methionine aminotransferase [Chitinophaga costaii]SCB93529.1 2-keto-4-methylthiobutyrate aminotransferase apoenzyme [Chitinophaga costaii]